jgi:putative MATE family efflux protein
MPESIKSPKNVNSSQKDWTRGPILRNLLLLSWPMIVMESLYVISQVVDMFWIGRLGDTAVAGAGIANIIIMLVMSADFGIISGVRAMIARHIGAGDLVNANKVAGQAIMIGMVWGAIVTIPGFLFAPNLMSMFGLSPDVISEGIRYMRVMFAGWIAMEILVMSLYVIQSCGDTLNPMKLELSIRCVHIALCPFLVLGIGFFPHLGVAGAALSNLISQILGACIGIWMLFSGRTRIKLDRRVFHFDFSLVVRILKIGIPALIMNLQRSVGNLVLTWFIAPYGTATIAAHSIVSRVEMFIFMPSMALGSGAGVLVGQNLGAKKPERAEKGAWLAMALVEIFILVCAVFIFLFASQIIGLFGTDPDLIRIGSLFMRIACASYLVLSLTTVLQNSIAGAGDTIPNMLISIVAIWAIQIPLAWLIPHFTDLGVFGIRWAIVITTVVTALVTFFYFRTGRWKIKRL